MKYSIRQCTMEDLPVLRNLSYETYDDTFRNMNSASSMIAYLEQAFNIHKMRNELSNCNSTFYFLYVNEKLAGYLKINEYKVQTDINDPQSLEVERIYVTEKYQGQGFGSVLLNKAEDIAKKRNKLYIWLGVWEENKKAISFYINKGFYKMGTHSFFMGEAEQTDYIMRKDLTEQTDRIVKEKGTLLP